MSRTLRSTVSALPALNNQHSPESVIKFGMRKIQVTALFTCTFLLLQFGTAVAAPSTKTAVTIPISLPVAQSGAITFANAESKFDLIPEVAWQRTQDVIAANKAVNIPTVIHIGPNTKASKSAITTGLNRLDKLFAGFKHVPSYTGIVYNAQDEKWAQTDAARYFKAKKFKGSNARAENIRQLVQAGCEIQGSKAVNCGGGMSWDFSDAKNPAGGAYYGVQSDLVNGAPVNYWTDEGKNVGPMSQVNHEATHNYQTTQFFNTPLGKNQHTSGDLMHTFAPWWFAEGHANAIGIPTFIESLDDYRRVRLGNVTRGAGSRTKLPSFTADGLQTLLTSNQVASPENTNYPLAYTIGYAAVEVLVAVGGPQSTLALYTLGAQGKNWNTAFKSVYGISWDEGASVIAKVVAAEYAANPMGR